MGKAFGNILWLDKNNLDLYTNYYKNKIYEKTSSWNYNSQLQAKGVPARPEHSAYKYLVHIKYFWLLTFG